MEREEAPDDMSDIYAAENVAPKATSEEFKDSHFKDGYCPPWLKTDENKAIAKKLAEDLGLPYQPNLYAPASYQVETEVIEPINKMQVIFGNLLSTEEFDEALDRQKCFDAIVPHLSMKELDEKDKKLIAPDGTLNSIFHKMSSTSGGNMSGKFKKVIKPERVLDRLNRTGSLKSDNSNDEETVIEEAPKKLPPDEPVLEEPPQKLPPSELATAPITDIGLQDSDTPKASGSSWLYDAMAVRPKSSIEDTTTTASLKTPDATAPSAAVKETIWLPDQLSNLANATEGTTLTESDAQEIAEQISVLAITDATSATISESDRQEIAELLGSLPLDEIANTDTSICEDSVEEWKQVIRSKSSGSSSKTEKGSDSNSTTERVRTRGEVLASSSNSEDILERQRLIKDQQSKKLEEQRTKQSQKKAKKES